MKALKTDIAKEIFIGMVANAERGMDLNYNFLTKRSFEAADAFVDAMVVHNTDSNEPDLSIEAPK